MSEQIKPALTPEQWELQRQIGPKHEEGHAGDFLHQMAALFLHGQPFGFTWADVDAIRDLLAEHEGDSFHPLPQDERDRVRSLADRIAALLPPREPPA